MEILFINLSLRPDSKRRHLPVGLAYIMTAVKRAGFEFDFIDMDIDQLSMTDLENLLSIKEYDVYAMGCIVTGYKWAKKAASIIRGINPQATIIAGNSLATSIPATLLSDTEFDIAVLGEGDITVVELLRKIDSGRGYFDVSGIACLLNGKVVKTDKREIIKDLDVIGFPDWHLFDIAKYSEYGKINANVFSGGEVLSFPLNSARGCPYNCTFCYHVFKEDVYRKYSEDAVTAEILRLHNDYDCNFISFWDELTFPTVNSVVNMINKFLKLDFPIGWEATTRGNLFKKEHVGVIADMRDAGADSISFSLENASPEILKAMNKKMDVAQFIEHANALWEGGVTPLTSVIFGYPQETLETIEFTLKVCEECNIFPSVGFLLPLPGTPIYDWAVKNGFIGNEVEYLERIGDRQDFHINLTGMDDDFFVETVTRKLEALAEKQGLVLDSVFKTVTYRKPEKSASC